MADLNKTAIRKDLFFSGTFGNKSCLWKPYTLAAAAADDKIYLAVIKAGTTVTDLKFIFADLGTGTTMDIGYEKVNSGDTLTPDLDYWIDGQDTGTAAGIARSAAIPVTFEVDVYLVATNLGGAGTGRIDVVVDYIYHSVDE